MMITKQKKLAAAAAAGAVLLAGLFWFFSTHIFAGGRFHVKSSVLDLRGTTVSVKQYEHLRAQLPDSTILWELPFQGQLLPLDTKELTVEHLTLEEAQDLAYLPSLSKVSADNCRDYDALVYLQKQHPNCRVSYRVSVGSEQVSSLKNRIVLHDAVYADAAEALQYLPRALSADLRGKQMSVQELSQLRERYPDLEISAWISLGGRSFSGSSTELSVGKLELTQEELETALPYLPDLATVDLIGTNLSQQDLKDLTLAHPDIFFLWEMEIAGLSFPTDAEEIDISGQIVEDITEVEDLRPYFPKLSKVFMSDCGIDNETMDILNRSYEDISYIWTVMCGRIPMRTDAKYFYPAGSYVYDVSANDCYNLRYCTEIIAVDIGHMWVTDCEWAAFMPHLKYLLIPMTGISDVTPLTGLKELVFVEAFLLNLKDYSPFATCPALEDLNISYTYGSAEPLMGMTQLKHLYWGDAGHGVNDDETIARLYKSLPNTDIVTFLEHSQSNEWRFLPNYYRMRDTLGAGYLGQVGMLMYWNQEDANKILACSHNPDKPVEEVLKEVIPRQQAERAAKAAENAKKK